MMFGWYEMDLALGRVRDIPPLQGLGFLSGPFTQGVALGYHIVPLWGGRPVPRWGPKIGAPLGRKTGALLGRNTGATMGRKTRWSG